MEFQDIAPVKEQILKCVRCGKCRSVCPVFAEIRTESAAPRGHVFIVQMLRDGKIKPTEELYEKLTNCLMCETCSVNCPSGLDIHEINAAARAYIYEKNPSLSKNLLFDSLWTRPSLLRAGSKMVWLAQKTGMQKLARSAGLTRLLPGDLPNAEKLSGDMPSSSARARLKEINPARGEKRFRVGYFLGCGTDLMEPDVAVALVDILTRNGCEIIVPKDIKCCGLPHIANGKLETARRLAAHNAALFKSYDLDYVVTDCASCSASLNPHAMEFLLGGTSHEKDGQEFASKTIDINRFLVDILDIRLPEIKPGHTRKVTWHDPCHLVNAQGIKAEPRELLRRIPGLEFVEMPAAASCCGGSGTYGVTHYDISMKILDKKMNNLEESGADILATSCPSCLMQLRHGVKEKGLPVEVKHPLVLIAEAYANKSR